MLINYILISYIYFKIVRRSSKILIILIKSNQKAFLFLFFVPAGGGEGKKLLYFP
jgi:hypothetical protein